MGSPLQATPTAACPGPHALDHRPHVRHGHAGTCLLPLPSPRCANTVALPNRYLRSAQHIGINYTRIIKAFIIYRNAPGGPAAFFNQLSEFTQIFGSTVYVAQTLIGDSVVVRLNYSTPHKDRLTDGSNSYIDATWYGVGCMLSSCHSSFCWGAQV